MIVHLAYRPVSVELVSAASGAEAGHAAMTSKGDDPIGIVAGEVITHRRAESGCD